MMADVNARAGGIIPKHVLFGVCSAFNYPLIDIQKCHPRRTRNNIKPVALQSLQRNVRQTKRFKIQIQTLSGFRLFSRSIGQILTDVIGFLVFYSNFCVVNSPHLLEHEIR